jgi:hypothetical protein
MAGTVHYRYALRVSVLCRYLVVFVLASLVTVQASSPNPPSRPPAPNEGNGGIVVVDTDMGDDDVAAISLLFSSNSITRSRSTSSQRVERSRFDDDASATPPKSPIGITTVFGVCSVFNATLYALGVEQAFLNSSSGVAPTPAPAESPSQQTNITSPATWPFVPVAQGASSYFSGIVADAVCRDSVIPQPSPDCVRVVVVVVDVGGTFMPWQDNVGPISAIVTTPKRIALSPIDMPAVDYLLQLAGMVTVAIAAILIGTDRYERRFGGVGLRKIPRLTCNPGDRTIVEYRRGHLAWW